MNEPAWVGRARVAIDAGATIKGAAEAEGKHPSSLRPWLFPEERERRRAKEKRWRERNPRRHRELNRRSDRRRRREKPEAFRAYSRRYDRDHRLPCPRGCGGYLGIGVVEADGIEACLECREREVHERRLLLVDLWAEGRSLIEIASVFETSVNALGGIMYAARRAGYDLPYRRRPR